MNMISNEATAVITTNKTVCVCILKTVCVKNSLARQVSDMDKGVIEGGEDVAHSEHVLSFSDLGSQADDLLLLLFLPFTRSHCLRR